MTNATTASRLLFPTFDAAARRPSGPTLWQRIVTWLQDQRRYRKTLAELERMSDRELDDLGISRFDMPQIAREAVREEHGRP